jgi:hypothetical protein
LYPALTKASATAEPRNPFAPVTIAVLRVDMLICDAFESHYETITCEESSKGYMRIGRLVHYHVIVIRSTAQCVSPVGRLGQTSRPLQTRSDMTNKQQTVRPRVFVLALSRRNVASSSSSVRRCVVGSGLVVLHSTDLRLHMRITRASVTSIGSCSPSIVQEATTYLIASSSDIRLFVASPQHVRGQKGAMPSSSYIERKTALTSAQHFRPGR